VEEAADAALRSAVFFCLEHHRRDRGQRDRDSSSSGALGDTTADWITEEDGLQASGGGGGEVVLR